MYLGSILATTPTDQAVACSEVVVSLTGRLQSPDHGLSAEDGQQHSDHTTAFYPLHPVMLRN